MSRMVKNQISQDSSGNWIARFGVVAGFCWLLLFWIVFWIVLGWFLGFFVTYSTCSWGHSFHSFFENQAVDHQVVSGTVVVSPDGSEDSSSGSNMVFSWKKDAEPPL